MQCTKCGGTGSSIKEPCLTCRGVGVARIRTEEDISIPKGVSNG